MIKYLKTLALAVLAGFAIGLGGLAYVACSAYETSGVGRILGSFLFSVGLLSVCAFSLFLFTGKVGYVFENKKDFILQLLVGYAGNFLGAALLGLICHFAGGTNGAPMGDFVRNLAANKNVLTGEAWYSALLLGIICGALVFIGVDIFKRKPGFIGTVGLILAVATFVVVGSEHCIANMFYLTYAWSWNLGTILNVLLVTLGNILGAWLIYGLLRLGHLPEKKMEAGGSD